MSGKNFYHQIIDQSFLNSDDRFEYDYNICKVALEKFAFNCNCIDNKCSACDGVGYFYLSDNRLIQCERCNGKG